MKKSSQEILNEKLTEAAKKQNAFWIALSFKSGNAYKLCFN